MVLTAAPPQALDMEQYRSDWQPLGWQLIIIGPTTTWRQEWGEWEAIRDIVQNCLDECEYYSWGYDDEGLYIRDTGGGIAVADFLLGPPKIKPDYARGKFGEGMKIAALALLRLGYPVRVETGGRVIWIVFLEQRVNGHVQTLAALWKPNGRSYGTSFHIIGYRGTAYEDRFAVNLPRQSIVAEGPSQQLNPLHRFNQLIRHDFADGSSRIYARDIYMRDINSPYSYNLWSFDMAPDRHGPKEESDMWTDVGRLWSCVSAVDHLQTFIRMVQQPPQIDCEESHNINMNRWHMGQDPAAGKDYSVYIQENAWAWQQAWRNVMQPDPEDPPAVIRTSDRLDGMVRYLGYRSVELHYNVQPALSRVILTDQGLLSQSQERLRQVDVIPDDSLQPQWRVHLNLARAITQQVFPYSPPTAVRAASIPAASDRVRTAGMYSTATSEIFISPEMLERGKSTVDTLVHELAHHRQYRTMGEAEDLTPSHAESMTVIAADVVHKVAGGKFDDLLREVIW